MACAFVRIGDREALWEWENSRFQQEIAEPEDPKDDALAGTRLSPGVLPRLALGLTKKGSLVGLFGYTVET
jgi:hypothetical protein